MKARNCEEMLETQLRKFMGEQSVVDLADDKGRKKRANALILKMAVDPGARPLLCAEAPFGVAGAALHFSPRGALIGFEHEISSLLVDQLTSNEIRDMSRGALRFEWKIESGRQMIPCRAIFRAKAADEPFIPVTARDKRRSQGK